MPTYARCSFYDQPRRKSRHKRKYWFSRQAKVLNFKSNAQNKKKASQNSRATNPPTDKNTNTPSDKTDSTVNQTINAPNRNFVSGPVTGNVNQTLIIAEPKPRILNTQPYEVKEIIELTDKFDVDSISKIIERTKNDENNKDVYWFTRAIYSIMQPISSTDDPISCINKIDKDSKFYRYSISIAREYLQANSSCESTPNKALINFANSMKEKGDISPLVDLTYYIESTIEKTDYGIGDERRFPFHENTQYKLCLQSPNYYVEAYTNIRHKFENENFKITYNGAHSINTGLNKKIRIDAIYLFLPQLIGALHGSAALSFSLQEIKSMPKMK